MCTAGSDTHIKRGRGTETAHCHAQGVTHMIHAQGVTHTPRGGEGSRGAETAHCHAQGSTHTRGRGETGQSPTRHTAPPPPQFETLLHPAPEPQPLNPASSPLKPFPLTPPPTHTTVQTLIAQSSTLNPQPLNHPLVYVDVQFESADEVLLAQCTADGEGQACGHLAPDQGHLGTQTKLACVVLSGACVLGGGGREGQGCGEEGAGMDRGRGRGQKEQQECVCVVHHLVPDCSGPYCHRKRACGRGAVVGVGRGGVGWGRAGCCWQSGTNDAPHLPYIHPLHTTIPLNTLTEADTPCHSPHPLLNSTDHVSA